MKTGLRLASLLFVVIAVTAMVGCGGGSGSGTPFFTVATVYQLNGFTHPDPNVRVAGSAIAPGIYCTANPNGTSSFNATTDGNGQYKVANAAVGGVTCSWVINRGTSANCSNPDPQGVTITNVLNGNIINVPCHSASIFNAGPSFIDSNNPPATITITGQNMSSTYGMPQVTIYDVNQNALLTVTATSASGDGTSITIPDDQIAYLGDGNYGAVVYVKQSNGTWDTVGGAGLDLWTSGGGGNPCNPPMPCC